jgi:streptogramin lyase
MKGPMHRYRSFRLVFNTLLGVAVSMVMLAVVGCGADAPTSAIQPGSSFSGRVRGGQQPISGASIVLYQAGSGGPGIGAASLLTTAVTTDANGQFSFTGDYTCPSSTTQVYLIATGGNPGLPLGGVNPASVMMAALGDCGNLSNSTFINMNEVTTVGAVWALSQFMAAGGGVGASATNATGLRNAFMAAANLVDVSKGAAGGAALPAGATLESAKLYTLADVVAACVNSDGGSACTPLFQAAIPIAGSSTPGNTLDAALDIVRHPGMNVGAVFAAATATGPFQPALSQAPNDWTMALTFHGGGLDSPTSVAVDSTGSVWAANYFGGAATKLSPSGQPASALGFADGSLFESYGITVDGLDNAWITNEESSSAVNSGGGSITKFNSSGQVLSGSGFTAGGIYFPYALAADSAGRIWVADYGRSGASLLASDGSSLLGSSGISPTNMAFPVVVAVDGGNNGWFGAQGTTVQITPSGNVSSFSCCEFTSGIAIDPLGDTWLTQFNSSILVELGPTGTVLQQITATGGTDQPEHVAVDGAGNIWITNFPGSSISGFTGTATAATSTALSPNSGFGRDISLREPFGLAIDASGNVWVSCFSDDTLTQFVGLASPIHTPLLGPPVQP